MPLLLTIIIAKLILRLSRLLGRGGGSALPGLVAERLDPGIAAKLVRSLPQGSIVVTGTNGKTTTTKMLLEILESSGRRVITNRSGSNLSRGIVSSLIEQASITGHLGADTGLFEVDEASMPAVCRAVQPKVVVVLNLFRDQLDRYGELDKTASLIGQAIAGVEADIYLNADDPLVASLAQYASGQVHYYGVEAADTQKLAHDMAADSNHCPVCGQALEYRRNFFGHIGHYRCPEGHYGRPEPEFKMLDIKQQTPGSSYKINGQAGTIQLPGLYNAYNALAAVAAAHSLGISVKAAALALERVTAAFGRVEKVEVDGRMIYLLLIKNPTGFNQVIQTFLRGAVETPRQSSIDNRQSPKQSGANSAGREANIMIAINDNFADGRDVSWLWDVAFEEIASTSSAQRHQSGQKRSASSEQRAAQTVIASGIRACDLALRLKYAEIEAVVEPELEAAFKRLVEMTPKGATAYVLPTYTAMLELRSIIGKSTSLKGFWK